MQSFVNIRDVNRDMDRNPNSAASAGAARGGRGGLRLVALAFCVLLLGLAGCAKAPYTGRSQLIMYSDADEAKMGLAAMQQVLKKEKEVTGTPESARVERVGRRIAAVAERPQYRWEFHTIEKDVVNAFCLPGGKVAVYTGLLDIAETDAELAAVVGHEVAHALARHSNEKMSRARMVQVGQLAAMVGVAAAGGSSQAAQAVGDGYAGAMNMAVMLPNSREMEYEADHIGLLLMAKAGYDPHAAIEFWQKMLKQSGGRKSDFLSTHPTEAKRIDALRGMLPEAMRHYRPRDDGASGGSGGGSGGKASGPGTGPGGPAPAGK
ncbi:M48 family metallopeptidase [Nitratidesulfovibrio sp. HK-II]|uniref:M48 family metallopeptidase n=1 Tax=Nitratidesulfovibrio sp. HK-II TaxID=2009266 RepID=UPI000E2F8D1D|nr:M48 family metallopeptidase [Nitratidesulfovibrio sp. HK-II]